MKQIEKQLAASLSALLNERGPQHSAKVNSQLATAADKVADALGDVRFMLEKAK